MELYNHQLLNEKLNIRKHRKHHKQKDGKSATTYYLDDILTFDIEVTSAWLENGKVIPYHKGEEADYWNNLEAFTFFTYSASVVNISFTTLLNLNSFSNTSTTKFSIANGNVTPLISLQLQLKTSLGTDLVSSARII